MKDRNTSQSQSQLSRYDSCRYESMLINSYVDNKHEYQIDIHVIKMKIEVKDISEVRIFWNKEKRKIKTPLIKIDSGTNIAVFNTHFQISAASECNEETKLPNQPLISTMKVKTADGKLIGEVELDISNFTFEKFKIQKLKLQKSKGSEFNFNPDETYVKVGLKGAITDGKARKQASQNRQDLRKSERFQRTAE